MTRAARKSAVEWQGRWGGIRRRWTKINQLTDFAGGISGRKWNVETRRLTREDRRCQTNADSEQWRAGARKDRVALFNSEGRGKERG